MNTIHPTDDLFISSKTGSYSEPNIWMKRTGIIVMDFWLYVDFMYGILFDGRIPARQSLGRKSIDLRPNL
jgi:hypothetical protein